MHNYKPAPDLLKDRVILVTGASDGIGAAAAKSFAAGCKNGVKKKQKNKRVFDNIHNGKREFI